MADKKFSEFPVVTSPVLADITVVGLDALGQNAQFAGSEFSGGVSAHPSLTDRDLADQHPIGAITSLQTTLDGKEPALGDPPADGYVLTSTAAGVRSWIAPTDVGVTSVNGATGDVLLTDADIPGVQRLNIDKPRGRPYVVVIMGQSDAGGLGTPISVTNFTGVKVWQNNAAHTMPQAFITPSPTTDYGYPGAATAVVGLVGKSSAIDWNNLGLMLGRTLNDYTADDVYLIPVAKGGSTSTDWVNGGTLSDFANAEIAAALSNLTTALGYTVQVDLVVWDHGQSDSGVYGSVPGSQYTTPEAYSTFWRGKRAHWETLWATAGYTQYLLHEFNGASIFDAVKWDGIYQTVADSDGFVRMISGMGLTVMGDNIHSDGASLDKRGKADALEFLRGYAGKWISPRSAKMLSWADGASSNVANSGSNVAYTLDTSVALSGSTKLLSVKNNGTEKISVDNAGALTATSVAADTLAADGATFTVPTGYSANVSTPIIAVTGTVAVSGTADRVLQGLNSNVTYNFSVPGNQLIGGSFVRRQDTIAAVGAATSLPVSPMLYDETHYTASVAVTNAYGTIFSAAWLPTIGITGGGTVDFGPNYPSVTAVEAATLGAGVTSPFHVGLHSRSVTHAGTVGLEAQVWYSTRTSAAQNVAILIGGTLGTVPTVSADHAMWQVDTLPWRFNGNLTVASGNLTLTTGNVVVTAGNVTVTAGDATITAGDLNIPAGDIIISAGRVIGYDTSGVGHINLQPRPSSSTSYLEVGTIFGAGVLTWMETGAGTSGYGGRLKLATRKSDNTNTAFELSVDTAQTTATTLLLDATVGAVSKFKINVVGAPAFWGKSAPPTTQATAGVGSSGNFVAGGGTTATSTSTWSGGNGTTAYTVNDLVRALKDIGILVL